MLWYNFPHLRKDKCSLMWRMVGCGFLPTKKSDPWNSLEYFHWKLIWETLLECWLDHIDFKCNCNNCWKCFSSYFLPMYTAAQWTAIFVAETNCTSTISSFCAEAESEKVLFLKTCAFCAIILHHRLWSLQIMIILSFCIWSHANMSTTFIPGSHPTDILHIS